MSRPRVAQADLFAGPPPIDTKPAPLRALTLHRPWPWSIFHAPLEVRKGIENRKWKPWPSIVGERIALHAGKFFSEEGADYIRNAVGPSAIEPPPHWADDGIIGTCRVVGWLDSPDFLPEQQRRWWMGPFCWLLEDAVALPEPILCSGAQGLWVVPDEIAARVQSLTEGG